MADAGIGEAALLAAVAPEVIGGAAAAGTTAATLAAALPAVAEGGALAAGTVAAAAPAIEAAVVPSLALATPAVEAAVVPTAAEAVASLAPTVTEAGAPISLFSTTAESQPITAGLLGQDIGFGAGNVAPGWAGETLPAGASLPSTPAISTGEFAPGLLDKLGTWWDKATLGEKLKAGGTLASGLSTAAKATSPTPQPGSKTTIRPGTTGKPTGGEQTLAQVVEALLKRRDAYTGAQYGTPVAYRPRGLLG